MISSRTMSTNTVKRISTLNTSKLFAVQSRNLSVIPPAQVATFFKNNEGKTIPIDASWYMPNVPINPFHEFMKQRLNSDSIFFDIEKIRDTTSPYPHMLPSKELFEKEVSELGIKPDSSLLIYDQQGIFSACRAAWMFEIFGHDSDKINILNTYPSYLQSFSDPNLVMKMHDAGSKSATELVTVPSPHPKSDYKADFQKHKVVTFDELKKLVTEDKIGSEYTLIDARGTQRFTGESPEPRAGLPSGHIKNAINLPFTDLLTPNKQFLSYPTLLNVVKSKGIDESKPIIVSCGTGVTACVVRSALQIIGFNSDNIAVYDGSWTEWAQRAPELVVKDV
ncbi:unnamed protein product [Ambrosiozyma monospora]|uniref:Unnamed protein product n=1 Tax=Ambrosiozyma monospora TaxID=43982 RepID=A0A9W6Z292_AMBMO|nr:unnamed protein product [Ambrosiozyma monospora]